jgi:hypothetical protein
MRKTKAEGYLRLLEEHLATATDYESALGFQATAPELCKILNVTPMTLYSYRREGTLTEHHKLGNAYAYVLGQVKEQLERVAKGILSDKKPLEAPASTPETETAMSDGDPFGRARLRAMKAAKEAYRDEILEAADQAEKLGNTELALRLFKDFIHMEEGLRVLYAGA